VHKISLYYLQSLIDLNGYLAYKITIVWKKEKFRYKKAVDESAFTFILR